MVSFPKLMTSRSLIALAAAFAALTATTLLAPAPACAQSAGAASAPAASTADAAQEVRAIYVQAPSPALQDPGSATDLINEARAARFNTIVVEVRSLGESYYASARERMAGSVPPRHTDPLGYIVDRARQEDTAKKLPALKVVAALDLLRAHSMRVSTNPAAGSILTRNPNWATTNRHFKSVDSEEFISLDPGVPEVRAYLVGIVKELATKYSLDGILLDGLRYPDDSGDWGYNPQAVSAFGAKSQPAPDDPAWSAWRRDQLTTLAKELSAAVREVNPLCKVWIGAETLDLAPANADAFAKSIVATGELQDWVTWGKEGIADAIVLKALVPDHTAGDVYREWVTFATGAGLKSQVIGAVDGTTNFNTGVFNQVRVLRSAKAAGVLLYDAQRPSIENRRDLFSLLGSQLFASSSTGIKLMNIQYTPRATPRPAAVSAAAGATTATLAATTATTATLAVAAPEATAAPVRTPWRPARALATPRTTDTPAPTAPPPTPTAIAVPEEAAADSSNASSLLTVPPSRQAKLQTFTLKNGQRLQGRLTSEANGIVVITTEDGLQVRVKREQITSQR